jgi:raffinose/stachyose/melibiose transport system permease protein
MRVIFRPQVSQCLTKQPDFCDFLQLIPILIGLFLASMLSRRPIPVLPSFVPPFFAQVISMVVVGVIWRWMFNPTFGPINSLLRQIGLDVFAISWLGDFTWALPAVGSIGTWVQYGFCMVLFLAGMQHIQDEYYEAASWMVPMPSSNLFTSPCPGFVPRLPSPW